MLQFEGRSHPIKAKKLDLHEEKFTDVNSYIPIRIMFCNTDHALLGCMDESNKLQLPYLTNSSHNCKAVIVGIEPNRRGKLRVRERHIAVVEEIRNQTIFFIKKADYATIESLLKEKKGVQFKVNEEQQQSFFGKVVSALKRDPKKGNYTVTVIEYKKIITYLFADDGLYIERCLQCCLFNTDRKPLVKKCSEVTEVCSEILNQVLLYHL